MTKLLWISRHAMTAAQKKSLTSHFGELTITQVSGSPANVHVGFEAQTPEQGETEAEFLLNGSSEPLKDLVKKFDEVAAVLPIGLLQQLLPFCNSGRILQAKSNRVLLPSGKVIFEFSKWEQVTEVKIVMSDL